MSLQLQIEAILFAAEQAVSVLDLYNTFASMDLETSEDEILNELNKIKTKYKGEEFVFELVKSGGGYSFLSKAEHHELIAKFLNQKANKKLSTAAMETLSIIAYKDGVTKSEIEQIRGVNADYTVHKLLEKELIIIAGKAEAPGRPILYKVSPLFLDYFGINSISELPQMKDVLTPEENSLGEAQ